MRVGFVGLGVLGSAIAANIAASGRYPVLGFDRDPDVAVDGVEPLGALDAVVAGSDVVFTCLPSADALAQVVSGPGGITATRRDNQILVELSTLAVADKEAARQALEESGRTVLDCPVSGNRVMALKRGLTAFCSGADAAYETVAPILSTFCKKTHFVGAFGNGTKVKFCGNILNLLHNVAAAEAMVVAIKSGIDPKLFHQVISGSGSSSAMFEVRGAMMADQDYGREGMNMSVPLKDSALIADHAASVGAPIALYQSAVQYYHAAKAQGLDHLDAAVVCKVMERMAACERGS